MSDQNQENQEAKAIQAFNFEGTSEVRAIIDKKGDPWFVAKDVAIALGYENPREAVRDHCKNYHKVGGSDLLPPEATKDLNSQMNIIKEPDLFRLILKSKLETAEKFQDWVVEEVLPAIRKHGYYAAITHAEHFLPEDYGYYDTDRVAELAGASIIEVNGFFEYSRWLEPSIDKHGRLVHKLTKDGKRYGIVQDSMTIKGVTQPRRIFWKERVIPETRSYFERQRQSDAEATQKALES